VIIPVIDWTNSTEEWLGQEGAILIPQKRPRRLQSPLRNPLRVKLPE
jgi:hypothetical protein